ncbi:DUF2087 domain-containing protein [Micromonosporaceae bacterium Da 78-11]
MPAVNEASALLNALSSPDRLALLAAVVAAPGRSLADLSAALGVPMKDLVKEVARLQECGLAKVVDRTVSADLSVLRGTADALVATLPIAALLATAPELWRYFSNGRLTGLTVDHQVKLKLAPLLARLLPDERVLSEAEVNEVLHQVHDDHAYLRRMLVDFGQLTRDGSANYRRAG